MIKPIILVVDDEVDVRQLCRINLEFAGFEVMEAGDGDSALAIIENVTPDLILLDVMMPRLDGFSVLTRLKTDADTASIPVIILTAKVDEDSQLKAWDLGAVNYLTKPFSPISLAKLVKRTLEDDPESETRRRKNVTQGLRKLQEIRATEPPPRSNQDRGQGGT